MIVSVPTNDFLFDDSFRNSPAAGRTRPCCPGWCESPSSPPRPPPDVVNVEPPPPPAEEWCTRKYPPERYFPSGRWLFASSPWAKLAVECLETFSRSDDRGLLPAEERRRERQPPHESSSTKAESGIASGIVGMGAETSSSSREARGGPRSVAADRCSRESSPSFSPDGRSRTAHSDFRIRSSTRWSRFMSKKGDVASRSGISASSPSSSLAPSVRANLLPLPIDVDRMQSDCTRHRGGGAGCWCWDVTILQRLILVLAAMERMRR